MSGEGNPRRSLAVSFCPPPSWPATTSCRVRPRRQMQPRHAHPPLSAFRMTSLASFIGPSLPPSFDSPLLVLSPSLFLPVFLSLFFSLSMSPFLHFLFSPLLSFSLFLFLFISLYFLYHLSVETKRRRRTRRKTTEKRKKKKRKRWRRRQR